MQPDERKQVVLIGGDGKIEGLDKGKTGKDLDREVELAKYKFWGELLGVGKTVVTELLKAKAERREDKK